MLRFWNVIVIVLVWLTFLTLTLYLLYRVKFYKSTTDHHYDYDFPKDIRNQFFKSLEWKWNIKNSWYTNFETAFVVSCTLFAFRGVCPVLACVSAFMFFESPYSTRSPGLIVVYTDYGHPKKPGPMWQTKYPSAVPKNLGLGIVDFLPCSEVNFLTGCP